jgi:hypothetical protein
VGDDLDRNVERGRLADGVEKVGHGRFDLDA